MCLPDEEWDRILMLECEDLLAEFQEVIRKGYDCHVSAIRLVLEKRLHPGAETESPCSHFESDPMKLR